MEELIIRYRRLTIHINVAMQWVVIHSPCSQPVGLSIGELMQVIKQRTNRGTQQ